MKPARKLTVAVLAAVGALGVAAAIGCSRAESATVVAAPTNLGAAQPVGARNRLVFFMNPGGRPCQLQDEVLRGMAAELGPRADVVYYKTTEAADLARFQEYGIRALPQLVVTDGAGRELRRATPGIQGPEQVRQLVTF